MLLCLLCIATPGQAQRVSAGGDDVGTEAETVDESEMTDSDAENKLNPDEYEDDTTEFEQSELAANDSQNEVTSTAVCWISRRLLSYFRTFLCNKV